MNISFKVINTTNSDIILKIDGIISQNNFGYQGEQVEFCLTDSQIMNASSITIENSDIVYDITQSCKSKVSNYKKPIIELEPEIGCYDVKESHHSGEDNEHSSRNSIPLEFEP